MAVCPRRGSRSLSRSPVRRKRRTRNLSRSVSRSPSCRDRAYRRSRSRSPRFGRTLRRHTYGDRNHTEPNRCLGVFNLPSTIGERDLDKLFGRYGEVDQIRLVRNHYSRESRGYAFIYFDTTKNATRARDRLMGANVRGREIRVDFSIAGSNRRLSPRRSNGDYCRSRRESRSRSRARSNRSLSPRRSRLDERSRSGSPSPKQPRHSASKSPSHEKKSVSREPSVHSNKSSDPSLP